MESIGERLRRARDKAGLSLAQVYQYEGIQKGHLSEMERGLKSPTAEAIAKLAQRYQTSADYLLGLTDNPMPAERRDALPFDAELQELARQLPDARREELYYIGEALLHLSEQQAARLRAYDLMMGLIEEAGGVEAVEALESALRADAAGDPARAWQLIDAFFAGRNAKQMIEKSSNQP